MQLSNSFLSLFAVGQSGAATLGIQTAIEISFAQDGARITNNSVRERFAICERIYKQLRGDLGWGVARINDYLPRYLRNELDGVVWEPDKRQCWMPSDGV